MNYLCGIILLLISVTYVYPRSDINEFDRFLEKYLRERSRLMDDTKSDTESVVRQEDALQPLNIQQRQAQPACLPQIWTCGPGLPPCCAGLMCYDGNAKRGRHCVARG